MDNIAKTLRFLLALPFAALCLAACTEQISFDVGEAEPRLCISGYICDEPGQYAINISVTGAFFGNDSLPKISDAEVDINGTELTPDPEKTGRYLTPSDFCAEQGKTYTLRVLLDFDNDGIKETYTATATTPDKVDLQYLLLQKLSNEADGPFMPFTTLVVFQDPVGPDYYGVHLYLTNAADSASPYIRYKISNTVSKYTMNYFDTDVEDGSLLFYPAYMLSHRVLYTEKDTLDIYPLDTLELELNCHSPEYYDYLQQLNDAASGSNPIFATPAGPIEGNISGGAYGAFGVYTVSMQKQAVPYYPGTWTDEQMTKRFGHDWRTLFNEETK